MADEYSTKRIINLPEESGPAEGDVFVVDNESTGTKKLSITGLIDPTLTKRGQAADAKATGDALNETNERLSELQAITLKTVPSTNVIAWEQGNLKPNTGETNTSSLRIRTQIFLPSNVYKISVNDDRYRINIYGYSVSDGTYVGMWMGTEFKPYSSAYTINYKEFDMSNAVGYRVKITLLKTDGTEITPTDAQYVDFDIPLVNIDEINSAIESTDEKVEALKTEVIKTLTSDGLFTWQQGNIKPSDGTPSDSSLSIRTRNYIPSNVRKLTVTNSAYKIRIYGYLATDRTFLGLWNGTAFVAYSASGSYGFSEFSVADADGNLVRIVLYKADGTEITVSDAVYLSCDVPVVDVDAITAEITDISDNIYSDVESTELMLWSQGNFNANTGGEASSTIAIRTGYVDKSVLSVRLADADHELSIFGYNNGTYIGMWDGSRFRTGIDSAYAFHTSFDMKDAGKNNVRFRIFRTDREDILPSEGASLVCKVMAYTVDDSTPTEYMGKEISVFDNILCIGDSLIAGGGNQPAGISPDQSKASRTVDGAMYSIPTQLSKMYGMETTNWGISGATTESWYNHYSAQSWSGHDAALLYIGSNDYNYVTTQGMTIAEGAEKSYTYLKNIISKLKTDNVGIRIFLCTLNPGSTKGAYAQYRIPLIAKMRQIADEEPSVFLIDMNTYGTLETYSPYHNGHPTPIGYNLMAKEMGSYISWTINNKPQSFKWIRWIGTEYAVGDNDTPTGDLPDVG